MIVLIFTNTSGLFHHLSIALFSGYNIMNNFYSLPVELVSECMEFLDPFELAIISKVCKKLNIIAARILEIKYPLYKNNLLKKIWKKSNNELFTTLLVLEDYCLFRNAIDNRQKETFVMWNKKSITDTDIITFPASKIIKRYTIYTPVLYSDRTWYCDCGTLILDCFGHLINEKFLYKNSLKNHAAIVNIIISNITK